MITCADFTFDGVIDGTESDGVLIFTPSLVDYQSGKYEPGDYEVTISGTPDKVTDGRTETVKITITLIDPCDSPIITVPELEDQIYKLTATQDSYEHPEFMISPDFCSITYSYNITPLAAGNTAIQRSSTDARTFTWFYNNDDKPINPTIQK